MSHRGGILRVMAVVAVLAVAGPCRGGENGADRPGVEVRLGAAAHDVGGMWSRERREGGLDASLEIVPERPLGRWLCGALRPALGLAGNTRAETNRIFAGLLWVREWPAGLVLVLGAGGAIHDGRLEPEPGRKGLGSRFLFRVPVEIGWEVLPGHRIYLAFEHYSNGGLASPNPGFDALGVRWGTTF